MDNIRNFSIIAHIDHGKSTLADRMLEITDAIEERSMREQVLDDMELERERGITIKMTPARMLWKRGSEEFILNLIDTPGHVDFAYEVSRALSAVEGVVLLVDSTQGVQAQTLSVLSIARDLGLVIIPVLSKTDSAQSRVDEVLSEVALLLDVDERDILLTSGKTGDGVAELLNTITERIPPPKRVGERLQALIFDFKYSDHRGIIIFARIAGGEVKRGAKLTFTASKEQFTVLETGVFVPHEQPTDKLMSGEIGYIVTGIKKPGVVAVGDTVVDVRNAAPALSGYQEPVPVIWASIYPESQNDLTILKQALERLRLTDSSISFEEESSGVMGKGFRCGFLGMLHMEIVTERLRREFDLAIIITLPTTIYEVVYKNGKAERIYSPSKFPDVGTIDHVKEQWARVTILSPGSFLGGIVKILHDHEAQTEATQTLPDGRVQIEAVMPLRELMRGFFDKLKSVSSGFASLSYEITGMHPAEVVRLDVLVAEEEVPAFARIVSRKKVEQEAERMVETLEGALPRQLFVLKIQAKSMGRILASRKLSALRKDVTGHLYGGDVTRKRKLLEKQKKGKKKLEARGKVHIPHEVFIKVMRG